jgi:integrase
MEGIQMAKIKGVTSQQRNGVIYWYARINGKRAYCGKDQEGYDLAVAARGEQEKQKTISRMMGAGLEDDVRKMKVLQAEFKNVKALANWYMTELPTVQALKSYKRKTYAAKHLLEYFGDKSLRSVEADDIERYRSRREIQGASSGTIDAEVSLLRTMYNLALKRKKIHVDCMPGEFVIENKRNPRPVITKEQYEELVKNAADEDFRDVLVCGYESAMRSSEIVGLRARQVHLDQIRIVNGGKRVVSYIDLGIFDTKTGARRTVPVSNELKEVLNRRLNGLGPDDYVFTYKGKKYRDGIVISQKMMTTCRRAQIPYGDKVLNEKGERVGIVFHCLRHSRTSLWVEAGFSDEIIRRATGHASLEAYRAYVKLDPAVVMRLVEDGIQTAHNPREAAGHSNL